MSAMKVAISQSHGGQIVQPSVIATYEGFGRVRVDVYWLDTSDGNRMRPESFTGTRQAAEDFLRSRGVCLDAQGIH